MAKKNGTCTKAAEKADEARTGYSRQSQRRIEEGVDLGQRRKVFHRSRNAGLNGGIDDGALTGDQHCRDGEHGEGRLAEIRHDQEKHHDGAAEGLGNDDHLPGITAIDQAADNQGEEQDGRRLERGEQGGTSAKLANGDPDQGGTIDLVARGRYGQARPQRQRGTTEEGLGGRARAPQKFEHHAIFG